MPGEPKTRHFTIKLIKPGFVVGDVLDPSDAVAQWELDDAFGCPAHLYAWQSPSKPPPWLEFFDGVESMDNLVLSSRTASAVLLLDIGGNLVAVTFGHAHHRVRRDAVVADFGLKTVLNAVDEDRLDAIDRTRIDEDVLQAREQSPAEGRIERFGINVQRDMLRGAAGTPVDQNLGSKLAGADALHATVKLELAELPGYLARLLGIYSLDTYKQKFPGLPEVVWVISSNFRASVACR